MLRKNARARQPCYTRIPTRANGAPPERSGAFGAPRAKACGVRGVKPPDLVRRSPRRLWEVGEKPTRSRHCKRSRRATARGPASQVHEPATELRLGKACAARNTRKSGNLAPRASFLRRARRREEPDACVPPLAAERGRSFFFHHGHRRRVRVAGAISSRGRPRRDWHGGRPVRPAAGVPTATTEDAAVMRQGL